jgi:hypothetical protein
MCQKSEPNWSHHLAVFAPFVVPLQLFERSDERNITNFCPTFGRIEFSAGQLVTPLPALHPDVDPV